MRVAIVHDWLTGMRGGERCLEIFCELFPEAHLYTLLHTPGSVSPLIERLGIQTSFIQRLPFVKNSYRKYLPLFPMAIERFNLKGYNLILSCSHCVAKGIIPPPEGLHICYMLTPMRYAWDMYDDYWGGSKSKIIPLFIHYLRMWDVTSSARVDYFLCISKHVQHRIKKFYRRDAEVIAPPVEVDRFKIDCKKGDYFLVVSSLAPYKRIDLAIEAFNQTGYPLIIIGSGPEEKRLRSLAQSNIKFLGWQADEVVSEYYSRCRALIFPGEEDFGIVPLEAMACGRPVIAYGRGGALETIRPYEEGEKGERPTGIFFYEQSVASMIEVLEKFKKVEDEFHSEAIRGHVLQWDRTVFKEKIKKSIFEKIEKRC